MPGWHSVFVALCSQILPASPPPRPEGPIAVVPATGFIHRPTFIPLSQVAQAGKLFDAGITMDDYLAKSFNKTATLIAAACKSAAVFSQVGRVAAVDCCF